VDSWPPAYLTPVAPEAIERGDGEYAIEFTEAFGSIGKDGVAGKAGQALSLRPWQRELVRMSMPEMTMVGSSLGLP
jgi:hypothetical protein